ncbi:MerR family transcriptional regulator [Spirochaeta lutea]|uniref:MerR family transcriptional regulator n=1 Tax=Spirochaeta lutea TaxID=1480694 RepID=UPI00068998FD|nr:MerR family transcriptional regulator [Spirochaeta lutea]
MTIKEVAQRTGLSEHTLRYYERLGIISGVSRSESGYRDYSEQDIGWIDFIQCLKRTGMPLEDLREFSQYLNCGQPSAEDYQAVLDILNQQRSRVLDQIEEQRKSLGHIEFKLSLFSEKKQRSLEESGCEGRMVPPGSTQ